jgi:hypothetical protein
LLQEQFGLSQDELNLDLARLVHFFGTVSAVV